MTARPFRSYTIERDAEGKPCRMVWGGDYMRVQPPHYLTCLRCQSARIVDQRCLDCWWRPTVTEQWRRV